MALDPLAPLRLGIRIGVGVLRFELHVVEKLLGLDRAEPEMQPAAQPVRVRPEPEIVPPQPTPAPEPVTREPTDPPRPVDLEPDEPAHVDVEVELVGEFAEAGAEEGAGAEVHVDEPWPGYRQMRVADIRDRVALANLAELAVVQLYESGNRERKSVLDAVERRSRELANAPS